MAGLFAARSRAVAISVVSAALVFALGLLPMSAFADTQGEVGSGAQPPAGSPETASQGDEGEEPALAPQEARVQYIDNTVDASRSHVKGVVELTDSATGEVKTIAVYSNEAAVTYSNPRTAEVQAMIDAAVAATESYVSSNGYASVGEAECAEAAGAVWDNRVYTNETDGNSILLGDEDYLNGAYGISSEYTQKFVASGDYGKETTYTVTLKARSGNASVASYGNVAGAGSAWAKSSSDGLTFTFKRSTDDSLAFLNFTGLQVDGKDVGKANYTAVAGSVVATLSASYLETLAEGDHTLTAVFNDGAAAASFTVTAAPAANSEVAGNAEAATTVRPSSDASGSALPATGDGALPAWALLVLAALASLAVVVSAGHLRAPFRGAHIRR